MKLSINTMKGTYNILRQVVLQPFLVTLALLLITGISEVKAQNYYVFMYNNNFYRLSDSHAWSASQSNFTEDVLWTVTNNGMPKNGNYYLNISRSSTTGWSGLNYGTTYTYSVNPNTTENTSYKFNLSNGSSVSGNFLSFHPYLGSDQNANFYLINNTTTLNQSNTNAVTAYTVTKGTAGEQLPNISISTAPGLTDGGIKLSASVSGTYVPACSTYVINTTPAKTYYYTTSADLGETRPGQIAEWNTGVSYSWAIVSGSGASITPNGGLLTFTGTPSSTITVQVTAHKDNVGSYSGYTGTQTITLNLSDIFPSSEVTAGDMIITPASSTIDLGETQIFEISSSIELTTTNYKAYKTVSGGGNSWFLDGTTLSTTAPDGTTSTSFQSLSNVSWNLTGPAGYATVSPASSTSSNQATVTRSALKCSEDKQLTLTAIAVYGSHNKEKTAIITIPLTEVDVENLDADDMSLIVGATLPVNVSYDLTDANGKPYINFTYNIDDQSVATVSPNGQVTAIGAGSTTLTITQTKLDNTTTETVTVTITVTEPSPTGISDDEVTINDLEDHSWSYYSDPECPIRSLNPADVEIIYYGNSPDQRTTMTSSSETGDNPTSFSETASGVKVGIASGEGQSTFIYYKTLERTDGDRTDGITPSGNCKYTTIPNPFQVRPTGSGSGNAKYRGFYRWRVKSVSGGTIKDYAVDSTIPAETEIEFIPSSEYGMKVELEALWAQAYVVTNNTTSGMDDGVSYERNFMVLTSGSNVNPRQSSSYAYTLSSVYPNGTSDGTNTTTTKGSTTVRGGDVTSTGNGNNRQYYRPLNLSSNMKFEYIEFNGNGNNNNNTNRTILSSEGKNLIVGRGCTETINTVRGLSGNTSGTIEYTIRLESGTIGTFNMIDDATHTHSGTVSAKAIFGCDYDRAKEDNSKLSIAANSTVYGASSYQTFSSNTNRNNLTYDWLIKSGTVQSSKGVADGAADNCIYMGNTGNGNNNDGNQYQGKRRLVMEGGEVCNISGGLNNYGNNYANYIVNDGWAVQICIKGGTVRGSVFGAAAFAGASGDRQFIFTGGTINGWVAGGANGTQNTGGELYGSTAMYMGGNTVIGSSTGGTHVGGTSTQYGTNGADGGHVFGAGCGILPNNGNFQNGTVGRVDNSTIVVADEAHVWRDVHGGGNYGWVRDNGSSIIYIAGGTIGGNNGYGNVFGGSNNQQGQEVNITVKGGDVKGGVYGGSHSWGTINDNVTINISGGTVETGVFGGGYGTTSNSCDVTGTVGITMTGGTVLSGLYGGGNVNSKVSKVTTVNVNGGTVGASDARADVHGGGLGSLTRIRNSVIVNIGAEGATSGAIIYGDVYGGSAEGKTNGDSGLENSATTAVTLNAGTINGSLYGGGLGTTSNPADVFGPVAVVVNGGSVIDPDDPNGEDKNPGSVFGCNNAAGSPKSTVTVTVNKTDPTVTNNGVKSYAINGVYGGGNQAHYIPSQITVNYPSVTINGCTTSIKDVFGGGNAAGVSQTNVVVNGGDIDRVFAGGNGTSGPAHVGYYNKTTGSTSNPYTGSDDLGIGLARVSITGGQINQVFGGSNSNGLIKTGGSVNINKGATSCDMVIGEVYGGGNEADGAAGDITIGCTGDGANEGIGDVYGGARAANVNSGITLSITGGTIGRVFGGNNISGAIFGPISVTVNESNQSCGVEIGDVYGGGNRAAYSIYGYENNGTTVKTFGNNPWNNPIVSIQNGEITGNVFGGGLGATAVVVGSPQVTIGDNVNSHTVSIGGSVFGGGDAAPVTGSTNVSVVKGSITNAVYGGGNNIANSLGVTANTAVSISDGTIGGGIYGGCNTSGTVTGDVTVTLTGGTVGTDASHTANIHGGGYGKDTEVNGDVTVTVGANDQTTGGLVLYGDLYGGSALGNVNTNTSNTTKLNLYMGRINGSVYGGGLGQKSGFYGKTEDIVSLVRGNVLIDLNGYMSGSTPTRTDGVSITGNVFGCNNLNGTPLGHVKVHVYKTVARNSAGVVQSKPTKNTDTYELASVYGGGNLAAYIPTNSSTDEKTEVIIDGCDYSSIGYVYGGGNAAPAPATSVTVNGSYEIGYVFGGGNGKDKLPNNDDNPGADVGFKPGTSGKDTYGTGVAETNVYGGMIHNVFGGSNTLGDVRNATVAYLDEASECPLEVDEIYGGGNEAYMTGKSELKLGCITYMKHLYGGSKRADVGGDINLTITSGRFDQVFGGNNLGGDVKGTITVNVEETGCKPIVIGELYGGGNNAAYSVENIDKSRTDLDFDDATATDYYKNYPVVNVKSFSSIGRVFGGGRGVDATITGNPHVNVNVVSGDNKNETGNNVTSGYTGTGKTITVINVDENDEAVAASETIDMPVHAANTIGAIGAIFGGGNAAAVDGDTYVNIGTDTTVDYVSKASGDSNPRTGISVEGANITGNVYGGGNQASVTGKTNVQIGPTPAP